MLRKIILENFMSHGRTEIDLADGLTVLTGPNNCGKSAVVAALQILASNGKTTHVTRHESKFSRVTVETDDGHTVVWERKGKTVKYQIDGEDIHRVGQSIPESLHDVLRLDRVQADTGKSTHEYDIHFGEQKSPVFLLGETGSRAASFFASSSDASRLVEMQHRHRTKVRERRNDAKRLSKEIEANEKRLQIFAPLDQIAESVKQAGSIESELELVERRIKKITDTVTMLAGSIKHRDRLVQQRDLLSRLANTTISPVTLQRDAGRCKRLGDLSRGLGTLTTERELLKRRSVVCEPLIVPPAQFDVDRLHKLIRELEILSRDCQISHRVVARCQSLTTPPQMEPAEPCRRLLRDLTTATQRLRLEKRMDQSLSKLESPPELVATAKLQDLLQRLTQAGDLHRQECGVAAAIAPLVHPPTFAALDRLQAVVRKLQAQQRTLQRIQSVADRLSPLKEPDHPVVIDRIKDRINGLRSAAKAVAKNAQAAEEAARAVAQSKLDLRAFVERNPTCEVCGGAIDPETLLTAVPSVHRHIAPGAADE